MAECLHPTPPPPPPVPLLLPTPDNNKPQTEEFNCHTHMIRTGQRAYEMVAGEDADNRNIEDNEPNVYISCHQPVRPLIQSGPQCGIVALAMVGDLLSHPGHSVSSSIDNLMSVAIEAGFTKQGEMLSIDYMVDLIKQTMNVSARVLDISDECDHILAYLFDGDYLLVPYDADKNHTPCLRKGHKAHWALICGFFVKVPGESLGNCMDDIRNSFFRDECFNSLTHTRNGVILKHVLDSGDISVGNVLVYGYHGKSKHPGLWPLQDLTASCGNLYEFDPLRAGDSELYVIPEGGIDKGLRNKIVVISRPDLV